MLLRNSAIFVASRALPGILGFATVMLMSWFLPQDTFGLYGMGIAIVMMANSVLFEWLGACVLRWHETHQDEPTFMPTILALFAGVSLAAALLVLVAVLLGLTDGHQQLAGILVFGTVAYGWFEFSSRMQICRAKPVRFLCMTLSRNSLILAGATAVAYLTRSAEATLLISFIAMGASGCLFLSWYRPLTRLGFDRGLARDFVVYGMPVGLTMIFSGLATTATPIIVGALAGYQAVGAFALGLTIVQSSLGVISTGISSAGYPAAVRAAERDDPSVARLALAHNYTLLLAALLPAGVGLAMLSPGIANVFVAPRYHDALLQTMPWLAASAVLTGLRATYVDYAFYLGKKTGYLIQVVGGAALVNLCVGAALIPAWHEVGASIAVCCASATALIHAALLARRAYPMPLPVRETCGIVLATVSMALVLKVAPAGPVGALGLAQHVLTGFAAYAVILGALIMLVPGRAKGRHRPALQPVASHAAEAPPAMPFVRKAGP